MELLVVVAIIALLLAVLVPALQKAKEQAKVVACMSNSRQLVAGWSTYVSDHRGRLMLPSNENTSHWIDKPSHHGGDILESLRSGTMYPYVQAIDDFHCPSDTSGYLTTSYAMSLALGYYKPAFGVEPRKMLSQIPRPSDTLVIVEEHDPRGDGNGGAWATRQAPYYTYYSADWVAPWHVSRFTVSMADGHSEAHNFQESVSSGLYRAGSYVPATNRDWQWLWSAYKTW